MKKIVVLVIMIAVIIGAVRLVKNKSKEIKDAPTPSYLQVAVKIATPKKEAISLTENYLGTIKAVNAPIISSKLSGFIKKVYVNDGDKIKKGQKLVDIDAKNVSDAIKTIKSNIKSAKLDLQETKKSYNRSYKLYKIGGISKESLEKANLAVELKKSKLNSLLNSLSTQENLISYATITSPIDGYVGEVMLREGSLVAPGKPIMSVVSKDKKIVFSFALSDELKVGDEVLVEGFSQKVTSIQKLSKNALGQAEVILTKYIKNPAGTSIDLKVVKKRVSGTIVPTKSILHQKEDYCLVYHDKKFIKQRVDVVLSTDEKSVIKQNITLPVAVASESKLSKLPTIKAVKVVSDE